MTRCENYDCGREVVFLTKRQRFCSVKCAVHALRPSRSREIRTCQLCSREYFPTPGNIKYGNPRFCSNECKHKARRLGLIKRPGVKKRKERVWRVCKNPACGKKYETLPKLKPAYCSRECFRDDASRAQRLRRPHQRPTLVCEHVPCSKVFVVPREHNKSKGYRRYCSDSCKWAARASKPRLCMLCGVVISKSSKLCLACHRREHAAPPKQPKQCSDCGVVLDECRARRCSVCSYLQNKAERNNSRYVNIHIGREMLTIFPDLRSVLARELAGYMGEQRRNRRKDVLAKIGAEGNKMFKLKQTERQ